MFKKILFATDGSEYANKLIEYIVDLHKKYSSEIVVFHSFQVPLLYTIEYGDTLKNSANKTIEDCKKIFENLNINVKTILLEGNAGDLILETAESENCDLIAISSRGKSSLEKFLIGSVSNYVINSSKIPVFIMN
ncbi:MAG: universal stress protein [Candidatus Sericytochromatia bacterium]